MEQKPKQGVTQLNTNIRNKIQRAEHGAVTRRAQISVTGAIVSMPPTQVCHRILDFSLLCCLSNTPDSLQYYLSCADINTTVHVLIMCTVVHDVYIVFYLTVYTVSVYSAIFTLHVPSLQGKFLIACISAYTLILSLERAFTYRVQTFTSNLLVWICVVLCFCFLFFLFFLNRNESSSTGRKQNSFEHTYIWHARNVFMQWELPPCIRTSYTIIRAKNELLSFTWAMSCFETQAMQEFISPRRTAQKGSSYWCKLNLKHTVYNELQKEIRTTVPVFKPNKHLSLRRALHWILQFTIYTEIYFVNGGVNTGVRSELVTGEWQSSGPAGRFNRQCLPLPHYHHWGALEQSP